MVVLFFRGRKRRVPPLRGARAATGARNSENVGLSHKRGRPADTAVPACWCWPVAWRRA